ncbi:MAG: multiprotein bridging factor aMBF1 [Haloarculaceae archaeon]
MVQCEMCGKETNSPNRVKIEGAELDVCDECTDFGTEVQTADSGGTTSTKYSTDTSTSGSAGGSGGGSTPSSSGGGSSGSRRGSDMVDDIEELAQDYDDRLRDAREGAGLSQEDLAKKLNEKASLIRKIEHGDTLPSDEVQRKLEGELDVDLTAGGAAEDTEWEGGESSGEYTLGDVVERKDS